MIEKCANMLTAWLIRCEAVKEEDKELYVYAVYSLLATAAPILLSILFGLAMKKLLQSVLVITPFIAIRKFSGGYHAKHAWTCLICSCMLLILCILAASCMKCNIVMTFITVCAVISLIIYSPIDSENRRLDKSEKKRYKRITIVLTVIFGFLCLLFYILHIYTCTVCFSIGLILTSGLQIPCIFQRKKSGIRPLL